MLPRLPHAAAAARQAAHCGCLAAAHQPAAAPRNAGPGAACPQALPPPRSRAAAAPARLSAGPQHQQEAAGLGGGCRRQWSLRQQAPVHRRRCCWWRWRWEPWLGPGRCGCCWLEPLAGSEQEPALQQLHGLLPALRRGWPLPGACPPAVPRAAPRPAPGAAPPAALRPARRPAPARAGRPPPPRRGAPAAAARRPCGPTPCPSRGAGPGRAPCRAAPDWACMEGVGARGGGRGDASHTRQSHPPSPRLLLALAAWWRPGPRRPAAMSRTTHAVPPLPPPPAPHQPLARYAAARLACRLASAAPSGSASARE